jgi:benzoate membrane transport protein
MQPGPGETSYIIGLPCLPEPTPRGDQNAFAKCRPICTTDRWRGDQYGGPVLTPRLPWSRPAAYLAEFRAAAAWAGLTAFIFMVFGALSVQISVLQQFGISESQQSSWITITWLTAGVVSLVLCFYYKQPLAIGWTLPGLLYMGSLSGRFTISEFAGANVIAAGAMFLIAVRGYGSKIIHIVPLPILMAMFGASILEYETRLVDTTVNDVAVAGPMVVAYIAGRLVNNRNVPPVGLAVIAGAVAIVAAGKVGHFTVESALPQLEVPGFSFSIEAALSISVPMVVLVLGLGNVQSLGFMIAEGYKPPLNMVTGVIGVVSGINAVFGGHPAAMARTVTAMVSGGDAGELDQRYWAAIVAFLPALIVALATGFVVAVIAVLPASYVFTMAGLAILVPFQDAMARGFAGVLRLGCVVAFVVTLSPITVVGIPSAFWALVAGIGASVLLERRELVRYWEAAFASPHAPIDHVVESMAIRSFEGDAPVW